MPVRLSTLLLPIAAALCGCGSESSPAQSPQDLIRSTPFSKLVLEVDHVPGFEPRPEVEQTLLAGLERLVDKPDGVELVRASSLEPRGSDFVWNDRILEDVADEHFDLDVDGNAIKLHVLVVDGHSPKDGESSKILGASWSHTHMVLYAESIQWQCETVEDVVARNLLCAHAELSVWTHELGHLLGLVNAGIPMVAPHEHERAAGHDENDECIMAFASTPQHLDRLASGPLPPLALPNLRFDDACLADLAAVRDR